MMKLTIRKKVLFCSLIPLLLLGGIILLIASTIVKGAIIDQVENSLKGTAIATQAAYDQNAGTYLQTENGDICTCACPACVAGQNGLYHICGA